MLPKGRRKFCSDRCRDTSAKRRHRARKRGLTLVEPEKPINEQGRAETTADGRVSARRPPDHFVEDGWFDLLAEGEVTQAQAARSLETTDANVSRWFEWCKRERMLERDAAEWEMGPEAKRALVDFRFFRERYFTVARGVFVGKPYVTTGFHLRWIDATLAAIPREAGGTGEQGRGGRQMILSPPRHGKTELMIHFCIWLILRNPDIVIIWISLSKERAEEAGSAIRGELERNEKLAAEMLGPGSEFVPQIRSGYSWTDAKFSVATRTRVQKAPTFRAFGFDSSIQSVDADFIVNDDLENRQTTRTPEQRASNYGKFTTEIASRKERHTAQLYIGSRNHPKDIPGQVGDSEDWSHIVETAHDELECEQPEHDEEAHVDCMMWHEKFDYSELCALMRANPVDTTLRYLNDASSDELELFPEAMMRSPDILDRSRSLGQHRNLPDGYDLIGSIDPGSKYQIAELWAWSRENPTRYLIDIMAIKGGMDAWEKIVKTWYGTYTLRDWVVEDNALQSDYLNRTEFAQFRASEGIRAHGATTGKNKHSLSRGVASMIPLYANKHIVLPYGDAETQGKVDLFIREHTNYDPDLPQTRNRRFDRVMAAWFAHVRIDSLQGGRNEAKVEDNLPDWMMPDGLDWIDDDVTEGWL